MTGAPTPRHCGRYQILAEVSRGGQGVVYRALQPGTHRVVALKRPVHPGMAAAVARERLEREVEAVARLDHPGIVTLYDVDEIDGEPMLVMEWVDGVPITSWSASTSGRRDADSIMRLFLKVCDAVQHAHQRGVLHRDLKPANILVDAAGCPRLLDFGLASDGSAEAVAMAGTLGYAAPELLCGARCDARGDVYSLGVVLYEMLCGRRPHAGGETVAASVHAILNERALPPSAHDPSLDLEVDLITAKALERDPELRYPTVDALAEDVRRWLHGAPILAHPPSTAYHVRKLWQRHRVGMASCLLLTLLLCVFAVFAAVQASRIRAQREQVRAAEREERQARLEAELEGERARTAERRARESLAVATAARALAEAEVERLELVLSFANLNSIAHVLEHADVREQLRDLYGTGESVLEALTDRKPP